MKGHQEPHRLDMAIDVDWSVKPETQQNTKQTSTQNVAEHADLNLLKLLVQKLRTSQQKHYFGTMSYRRRLTLI